MTAKKDMETFKELAGETKTREREEKRQRRRSAWVAWMAIAILCVICRCDDSDEESPGDENICLLHSNSRGLVDSELNFFNHWLSLWLTGVGQFTAHFLHLVLVRSLRHLLKVPSTPRTGGYK